MFTSETIRVLFLPVEIGNNMFIGERASFLAAVATIYISDHVMFDPYVTIRGGITESI